MGNLMHKLAILAAPVDIRDPSGARFQGLESFVVAVFLKVSVVSANGASRSTKSHAGRRCGRYSCVCSCANAYMR